MSWSAAVQKKEMSTSCTLFRVNGLFENVFEYYLVGISPLQHTWTEKVT